MPKKRKAAPPPAFTGTILPIDHAIDPGSWTRTGPLRVVRTLDGDAAASEVVLATDETTGEDTVIKAELLSAPSTQVYHDRNVLDWLLRGRGQRECPLEPGWTPPLVGLPRLHKSCESRLIMHTRTDAATGRELPMRLFAMEVLGPSLERALRESPRGLPAAAVRALGRQLLDAMEYIHSNGYLHCDVKPANFLLKGGAAYIVDFGIAKKFVETIYRKPSERDTPGPKFRHSNLGGTGEGTSEWKSCFAERCDPLGRREDMEPLGFVLLKLSTGELPWEAESQEGAPRSKAEEARVGKARLAKKAQPAAKLCAAIKDGPLRKAVLTMLESARAMGPMDKPDYPLLRKLLSSSAADTKAGEKELLRLEAACSGGAAAAGGGAAAASGSPSPPKKKKTAHRRSSGGGASGGARAASPADKKKLATKRMAMAKSLGRAAAQQPAAAAAAAASPQRRKPPSASGKAKAKATHKRRASPSPAPAARSENVCEALVDLCDQAKGRVGAAQRTALAEAIEAVDSAAEAGDGRAQAASAVVEEALGDGLEGVKVGELRALGKRLKQALDDDRPSGAAAAAETIDLTEAEEEGAAAAAAPRRDALRPRSPNRRASSERAQRQCAEPAEAAAAAAGGADEAWSVSGVFSAAAGMYRNLTSQ